MSQKPNSMNLFRLAKKARGLASAEKQALVCIADACSMRDGICRKSVKTHHEEHGCAIRSFRYGVRGRQRKNGTDYFPGLVRRGIVSVVSGGTPKDGVPTVYRINEHALRAFCSKEVRGTSAQTSAQHSENLCTNDSEPLHNRAETSARVQPSSYSSSKDNSKTTQPVFVSQSETKTRRHGKSSYPKREEHPQVKVIVKAIDKSYPSANIDTFDRKALSHALHSAFPIPDETVVRIAKIYVSNLQDHEYQKAGRLLAGKFVEMVENAAEDEAEAKRNQEIIDAMIAESRRKREIEDAEMLREGAEEEAHIGPNGEGLFG